MLRGFFKRTTKMLPILRVHSKAYPLFNKRLNMDTIKAIIWDADGVLITNKHRFSQRLSEEYGLDVRKMTPFFTGVFRECGVGRADLKVELEKVMIEWGWRGTVDELIRFWLTEGTVLDPEMMSLAQAVHDRGVPSFMATDNEKYRGERLRTLLEGKVIDRIFLSAELGCRKNSLEFWQQIYNAIYAEHPVQKSDILYIDDDAVDIDTARSFGLQTYLYDGNFSELREHV